MPIPTTDLPVAAILEPLSRTLDDPGVAVLVAPPGAGKTTLVPLALLDRPWRGDGRILLLEPRRLAARAAARRMASLIGEEAGATVGYATRLESRSGPTTRILVVTEGVLARMILDDPELPGVAAIVFDEFHERSLDGDFGLALALDVRSALRSDLRLLVMSATLDGARVAGLLGDAPVVESRGRSFAVGIRHRDRPAGERIEDTMAATLREVVASEPGSVLAFLPGRGEIERTMERLSGRLPADVDLVPLHGDLEGPAQDAAIRPAPAGRRKIVLATSIAESSVTIDGVRVVVDSGLARVPRYEPATGLTSLETVRVSRASADQRAGRAGRTAPGVAIRLWHQGQTASLAPFSTPEIREADLSGLVLDCAAFGVSDPASLAFLDPPPEPAIAEARALLRDLGALGADGRITAAGRAMRRLALPARLAHMVAEAPDTRLAAEIAVLLTERGIGGTDVDLEVRLSRFRSDRGARAQAAGAMARRLAASAKEGRSEEAAPGTLLLLAYPDRVARARGGRGRFVLANGRGAMLDENEPLAAAPWLVVADLRGGGREARIAAAVAVTEDDVRTVLADRVEETFDTTFDAGTGSLRSVATARLGAITMRERQLPPPRGAAADAGIVEAVRSQGPSILPWDKAATALRQRLGWLHRGLGEPWPDIADEALAARLEDWLLPFLSGSPRLASITPAMLAQGLTSLVPHHLQRQVDQLAPTHFRAPSGSHVPIRYDGEWPVLAIRVQELFGLDEHPSIAQGKVPLTLELLSPAHRPIQTTRDLPGFWRGSWAEVRAQMRGRYPRHPWPDDPLVEAATSRAKPRGK